jgi:hypothetical protein
VWDYDKAWLPAVGESVKNCLERRWLRQCGDEWVLDQMGHEDMTYFYTVGVTDVLGQERALGGEWQISTKPSNESEGSWIGVAIHSTGLEVKSYLYLDPSDEELYPSFKISNPA